MTWQTALSSPKQENNEKEVNGNLHCPMQWDANVSWVFVKTP